MTFNSKIPPKICLSSLFTYRTAARKARVFEKSFRTDWETAFYQLHYKPAWAHHAVIHCIKHFLTAAVMLVIHTAVTSWRSSDINYVDAAVDNSLFLFERLSFLIVLAPFKFRWIIWVLLLQRVLLLLKLLLLRVGLRLVSKNRLLLAYYNNRC